MISDRLRDILVATGWSQEALAARLGVSFVSLNAWINDRSSPRPSALDRIDELYVEVMGIDSVDRDELSGLKTEAERLHYSARKLVRDNELLKNFTTALTYHTNATEGSTMTESDVEAVVYNNQMLRNRTSLEQREAINHQSALYFLLDELDTKGDDFIFTPELVKSVHLRMMNGIVSDAGLWRNHGVRVTGSHVARANYVKLPDLMENWCVLANSETRDKIELLARTHAEFERIHPFSDGNGRTGRLLLVALALRLKIAPPILKKERKHAYYKYLELAHAKENTDPLEMYIARSIIETAKFIDETL